MSTSLRLRPLRSDDEAAFRHACRELESEGFDFGIGFLPEQEFEEYLERLERERLGIGLASDRVPATFLVAEVDGEIVGRVSVRHRLNDRLSVVGGHIGYGVLPAHRRRGLGTAILREALGVAQQLDIDRVLLTTDATNRGSQRVIESNGGVRERGRTDELGIWRYWIAVHGADVAG